jgi:hypothetical protein
MDGNGSNGGSSAADRLAKFRVTQPPPPRKASTGRKSRKRPWVEAPFFAISCKHADHLWACGVLSPTTYLLIVLDRLAFGPGSECPVSLTPAKLALFGIKRWTANRALYKLEKANIVTIDRRPGRCPVVTPLWRTIPPS